MNYNRKETIHEEEYLQGMWNYKFHHINLI
jgi:hypothetical protein